MKRSISPIRQADRRFSGFTLVELLVVIVIIASLAALTVTVVKSMNDKARQSSAVNAIKQVATANVAYGVDNNSRVNESTATSVVDSFWGRLTPYLYSDMDTSDPVRMESQIVLRLENLFGSNDLTTMAKTFQQGITGFEDEADLVLPFAFNYRLDPNHANNGGAAPRSTLFPDTSQILHFCYGSGWVTANDVQSYVELPNDGATRTSPIDWFPSKTAAFIFLDGHLEMISPDPNFPERRLSHDAGTTP